MTKGAPEDVLSLACSYQATDNLPPHPLLATTSVVVLAPAVLLPFTPLGDWLGLPDPR